MHRRADVPAIGLRPNWGDLDIVFPSAVGTLRDPSNIDHQLKDAFTTAGYPRHHLPHLPQTVATLMDKAGLSARAGADQLGHSQISMTQNTYWGRETTDTGAAQVLEALALT